MVDDRFNVLVAGFSRFVFVFSDQTPFRITRTMETAIITTFCCKQQNESARW